MSQSSDPRIRLVGVRVSHFEGDEDDPDPLQRTRSGDKRLKQTSLTSFIKKAKINSATDEPSITPGIMTPSLDGPASPIVIEESSEEEELFSDDHEFLCLACQKLFATIEKLEAHMEKRCRAIPPPNEYRDFMFPNFPEKQSS